MFLVRFIHIALQENWILGTHFARAKLFFDIFQKLCTFDSFNMSSLDILYILYTPFSNTKGWKISYKILEKRIKHKIKTVDLKAEELFIKYSAESFQVTGESLDPSGIPR